MQAILTALKDIPGVVGSFVLTPQGTLAAREMPPVYPDDIFPELGRRLATIGEVVDSQMGPMQELLMKFEGFKVFVRHAANCCLTVLVAESVNFPALRMATNVALKQVVAEMEANPPAAPVAPAPVPAKPQRFFRGQLIDR
jgi:predicted regulator of Ras-like GTPase activity (Roadblock/LC7/MglB family)